MDIEHWRHEIDQLDEEILRLLNMRARLAMKVGALKKVAGLPLNDPNREQTLLARLVELNSGPLDSDAIGRLFRRIIHESRRIQSLSFDQSANAGHSATNGNGFPVEGVNRIS